MPSDNELRRLKRAQLNERSSRHDANRDFGSWFKEIVNHIPLPPGKRSHYAVLVEAMGADINYAGYLKRVADGSPLRSRQVVYNIGEGLYKAGIPWSSGLLALYQHSDLYVEVYNILSNAYEGEKSVNLPFIWLEYADLLMRKSLEPKAIEKMIENEFTKVSDSIRPHVSKLIGYYGLEKLRETTGPLARIYIAITDLRLSEDWKEIYELLRDKYFNDLSPSERALLRRRWDLDGTYTTRVRPGEESGPRIPCPSPDACQARLDAENTPEQLTKA